MWIGLALLWSAPALGLEPIPVAALFGAPPNHSACISPDARYIALVHRDASGQQVLTQPLAGGGLRPVARLGSPDFEIRWLHWVGPQRLLARLEGAGGVRLISIGTRDGRARPLPHSEILSLVPDDPEHVVVAVRDADGLSVQRMHTVTGELELLQAPVADVAEWHVDPEGRVRGATLQSGALRVRAPAAPTAEGTDAATDAAYVTVEGERGLRFAGFAKERDQVLVFLRGRGHRRGVHAIQLPGGEISEVFTQPDYDVSELEFDARGVAIGARYVAEKPRVFYFAPEIILERLNLDNTLPDHTNRVVGSSLDGSKQLVHSSSDAHAPKILLYDRAKKRVDPILSLYPDVADEQLSPTRTLLFEARDSVQVPALLTLPKGGGKKLPTLVLVHDGPLARDDGGFDPVVQLFTSRGFAVFQIQYRGSFGYGRYHEHAGHAQWGLRMLDDVEDGARWLVSLEITDPKRLAIHGMGYGGYVAVQSLVDTPTLYTAASSYGGFFDLDGFADPDKGPAPEHWRVYVQGDRPRGLEGLREVSPLHRSKEIIRPVLLAHGSADTLSPPSQSKRLAEALGKRAHAVTYLELDGAGHELLEAKQRLHFYTELIAFHETQARAQAEEADAQ